MNANKAGTTAAERHCFTEKKMKLDHPVYFKDALTSEWKSGNALYWRRGFVYMSTCDKGLLVPSKLIMIRSE